MADIDKMFGIIHFHYTRLNPYSVEKYLLLMKRKQAIIKCKHMYQNSYRGSGKNNNKKMENKNQINF